MAMKGIDVSYANGSIDWEKAKNEIDFAIIRSSFGSDLPSQTDNYFFQNASGCTKNSIPFGIYHFAYFVDTETAKKEADFAIRLAKEYKDVRFIALDVEEDSERYASRLGRKPDWTACCTAFMERIKAAGYIPVFYSNQSWLTSKLDFEKIKQYKLWYAAPGASQPRFACSVWQYSWKGKVSGIIGDVDMDYCYDESLFSDKKAEKPTVRNTAISQLTSSKPVDFSVVVTSDDGVNIRSGAGVTYSVLGAVPCGEELHISKQTSGGRYTWGLATYKEITGWIALDFTMPILKAGDKVRVTPNVKLSNYDITMAELLRGAVFEVKNVFSDKGLVEIGGIIEYSTFADAKDLTIAK